MEKAGLCLRAISLMVVINAEWKTEMPQIRCSRNQGICLPRHLQSLLSSIAALAEGMSGSDEEWGKWS
jgi:hypothetical protein